MSSDNTPTRVPSNPYGVSATAGQGGTGASAGGARQSQLGQNKSFKSDRGYLQGSGGIMDNDFDRDNSGGLVGSASNANVGAAY